ncbi:MAG: DsbA family protein [Fimbriimonadaceae bacterium]|nr:DsbA family protein [Fimbriimonadaceae bacterium]
MIIEVAHDYNCPWCWIGIHQADYLEKEFGVQFEFMGYELMPEELPWGESPPVPEVTTNRPKTPSRMDLAYLASNVERPPKGIQPKRMRTHNALLATEYAKSVGKQSEFVRRLYDAYWLEGIEINALENLRLLAEGIVDDPEALVDSVLSKEFESKVVKFDSDAYAAGVYNVPTFFIGGERYAEQPTAVLREAVYEALK